MSGASSTSRIAVVGAGRMGLGISLSLAWSGYQVQLIDSEERSEDEFSDLKQSVRRDLGTELSLLQRLQLEVIPNT